MHATSVIVPKSVTGATQLQLATWACSPSASHLTPGGVLNCNNASVYAMLGNQPEKNELVVKDPFSFGGKINRWSGESDPTQGG